MRRASTRADFAFWEYRILPALQEAPGLTVSQVCLRCGAQTEGEEALIEETLQALVVMRIIDHVANDRYAVHREETTHD